MNNSKSEVSNSGNFFLPPIEGLSLGHFQIPDLSVDQSPSLGALASEHLSSNSCSGILKLDFDLAPSKDTSPLDLAALANLHLETCDSSAGFKIPSLFANEPPIEVNSTPYQPHLSPIKNHTIDLTAALNLVPEKPTNLKKTEKTPKGDQLEHRIPFEVEILVQPNHWNKENLPESEFFQGRASAFGKVLSRRWRGTGKLSIVPEETRIDTHIKPFHFDCASPDDIVRIAQSKSSVSRSK